jgi:hypothetical protein
VVSGGGFGTRQGNAQASVEEACFAELETRGMRRTSAHQAERRLAEGITGFWGLHLSGASDKQPRHPVVEAVSRAKILWPLRLNGDPQLGLSR